MKQAVINFARDLHIYNFLRHNRLYHAIERLRKPEVRQELKYRMGQLRAFVGSGEFLAFDVGANIGQFTAPLLELGARVVSVEPDPDAAEILRIRFWGRRRAAIVQCAISDKAGTASFYRQHPGSQRNTLHSDEIASLGSASQVVQVNLTTLDQLIKQHGAPLFLKIDVEGHEFAVLKGLRHAVPRVMFECNTPSALPEGVRCVQALQELSPNYVFALADTGTIAPETWYPHHKLIEQLEKKGHPVDIFARLP